MSLIDFVGNVNFVLWVWAIWNFYTGLGYGAIGVGFDVQVYRSSGD